MAEIFRPVYHVDPATGKRVKANFPGAVRRKSKTWHFRYYLNGERKKVKGYTDKKATENKAAEFKRLGIHIDSGLVDPAIAHAKRLLVEHLAEFIADLEAKGCVAGHIAKTKARILAILDGCEILRVRDLNSEKVAAFLHGLRQRGPRPELPFGQQWFTRVELVKALDGQRPAKLGRVLQREALEAVGNGKARRYPRATVERLQDIFCRGIGISTSNGYATAIKSFTRWLLVKERIGRDPMISLARLNAATDRRHARRALAESELRTLLTSTETSDRVFRGLSGPDRKALYALAMTSGFRAKELASLTPASFFLDGDRPAVIVRAGYAKNRREAVQPLPLDVGLAFQEYLADIPREKIVWPGQWYVDAAEMLRGDLDAAGIAYRDEAGQVIDFHALRHSYVTLLSRSGVSPKHAQELARHSDPKLTMNVYTHLGLYDLSDAVNDLPCLLIPPNPSNANVEGLRATGTEGKNNGGPMGKRDKVTSKGKTGQISLGPNLGPYSPKTTDDVGKIRTTADFSAKQETLGNIAVLSVISKGSSETTRLGFEPRRREPKSLVLPLHYRVSF
jgi:integrase